MRKFRTLLTVLAILAAAWLIYSLLSGKALSPMLILGILLLLLFALILPKGAQSPRSRRQSEAEISPSQRKSRNQHKSWLNRTD